MRAEPHTISLLLNDRVVECAAHPSDTLLDFIRERLLLCGTKEGCAEGDCGACTVLVGRPAGETVQYKAVNACIRLLPSLAGCHVVTIEHLRGRQGARHPVQQAMIAQHASQCGFCTPGIVMALYALWLENPDPDDAAIETALQGNLCRCTGYGSIVRAARAAAETGGQADDILMAGRPAVLARLRRLSQKRRITLKHADGIAILPRNVDDLAEVLMQYDGATIVAGATDVGLWITKHMRDISPAVFISHLEGLEHIEISEDTIAMGAGVSYTRGEAALVGEFPHLGEYWRRIGGWQVRNMGTLGGNIANGSPIADTPPVLISLGARLVLRRGDARREIALEDFFIDYGKQDRQRGEFIESIVLPRRDRDICYAAYKISKRRDEDISTVCGGFRARIADNTVTQVCLAFGGMAAIPKRAFNAEKALLGKPWTASVVRAAMDALDDDFTPISDWRASAAYRALAAKNLIMRFYLESTGQRAPFRKGYP